jgi:uncharacterized protein (DUF885 family)
VPSPIFELCDEFINASAALLPLQAVYWGIPGHEGAPSDLSPSGEHNRAVHRRDVLSRLDELAPTDRADELAALHLRERLQAEQAAYEHAEYQREVVAGFGLPRLVCNAVDLLPQNSPEDWQVIAATLRSVPQTLASWRASLEAGVRDGRLAARRQALGLADQVGVFGEGAHQGLLAAYGSGALAEELAAAAAEAHTAYAELAGYLRTDYAAAADETDGVGEERYLIAAQLRLGARIDPAEAYEWAWDELHRIEDEMVREAAAVAGSVPEAVAMLDETDAVDGQDAYHQWLQERHEQAVADLNGRHFDIAPDIRQVRARLVPDGSAAYYVGPSEDLTRPGTTWWPVNGRQRFALWSDLTTVFHEGVPGHHLQIGHMRAAGDGMSRHARLSNVSGNSEGWALYAERLADELGWFDTPGRRLGMLLGSALRAARVVIDLGVHLGFPLPAGEAQRHGPEWTFDNTLEVLSQRAFLPEHRLRGEAMRYFGWPAQASCYKLGERAWLAAREAARQRLGTRFDLKAWHTAGLNLGGIGLDNLTIQLAAAPL